jgi:hypothetical protein
MSVLTLKRFLEPARAAAPAAKPAGTGRAGERCEFCGESVLEDHAHVVNLETRALACACRACYLLFMPEGAAGGKYRSVPDRYLVLRGSTFTPAQWDELQIPVGIAFVFYNSALGRAVAFYPSPAGATESLLSLETWEQVVRQHPVLATLAPDVEALLVQRTGDAFACYVAPIDACYELVGRIRRTWKGFDGGEEARAAIDGFFAALDSRGTETEQ